MRYLLPLLILIAAAPARAHTGHLADVGGHDHWGLAIGLGVIAGAAAAGWLKSRKGRERADEAKETDADAEGTRA